MAIEEHADDWREIRSRADSTANAVFLLAGGALSLSISVLLGASRHYSVAVISQAIWSWYLLLGAMALFLLLKGHLIWQAYMLQFNSAFVDRHLRSINRAGWGIGCAGFLAFVLGMVLLVTAASGALQSSQAAPNNSFKPKPLRGSA